MLLRKSLSSKLFVSNTLIVTKMEKNQESNMIKFDYTNYTLYKTLMKTCYILNDCTISLMLTRR